jgi:hypothetical protein
MSHVLATKLPHFKTKERIMETNPRFVNLIHRKYSYNPWTNLPCYKDGTPVTKDVYVLKKRLSPQKLAQHLSTTTPKPKEKKLPEPVDLTQLDLLSMFDFRRFRLYHKKSGMVAGRKRHLPNKTHIAIRINNQWIPQTEVIQQWHTQLSHTSSVT